MDYQICRYCSQPIEICRKQDKKLIKPFHGKCVNRWVVSLDIKKPLQRYERAMVFVKGCYNPVDNKLYVYLYDTLNFDYKEVLNLPLCVWEDAYIYRWGYETLLIRDMHKQLGIPSEITEILIGMFHCHFFP